MGRVNDDQLGGGIDVERVSTNAVAAIGEVGGEPGARVGKRLSYESDGAELGGFGVGKCCGCGSDLVGEVGNDGPFGSGERSAVRVVSEVPVGAAFCGTATVGSAKHFLVLAAPVWGGRCCPGSPAGRSRSGTASTTPTIPLTTMTGEDGKPYKTPLLTDLCTKQTISSIGVQTELYENSAVWLVSV